MSINRRGFLSDDIHPYENSIKEKFVETFEICNTINEFAQKLLFELVIHNRLVNELIIAAAYKRLLSSFQATIILAEKGMVDEMKIVSRNLLEQTFLIIAISKNCEFATRFVENDEIQRKKLLNKYCSLSPDLKKQNAQPAVSKSLGEINTNINDNDIKELKTWQIAKEAELLDDYNTYYSILSLVVHPSIRDFENDYKLNESNEIISINFGPKENSIEKVLLSNAGYLLDVISKIKHLFKSSISEDIKVITDNFLFIWNSKFKNNSEI